MSTDYYAACVPCRKAYRFLNSHGRETQHEQQCSADFMREHLPHGELRIVTDWGAEEYETVRNIPPGGDCDCHECRSVQHG